MILLYYITSLINSSSTLKIYKKGFVVTGYWHNLYFKSMHPTLCMTLRHIFNDAGLLHWWTMIARWTSSCCCHGNRLTVIECMFQRNPRDDERSEGMKGTRPHTHTHAHTHTHTHTHTDTHAHTYTHTHTHTQKTAPQTPPHTPTPTHTDVLS